MIYNNVRFIPIDGGYGGDSGGGNTSSVNNDENSTSIFESTESKTNDVSEEQTVEKDESTTNNRLKASADRIKSFINKLSNKQATKTTVNAENYADRLNRAFHPSGLFNFTDEEALKNILGENSKLTSADIVAIAQEYNKKYYNDEGSLIRTIDKETSGKDLDEIAGGYAKHLIQAAKDGVPGAIELIATELYEAGENRSGCTCEQFIDVILNDEYGLPDDLLAQVRDYYDSKYPTGLADAIYDEYSGLKADNYQFKIVNAGEE